MSIRFAWFDGNSGKSYEGSVGSHLYLASELNRLVNDPEVDRLTEEFNEIDGESDPDDDHGMSEISSRLKKAMFRLGWCRIVMPGPLFGNQWNFEGPPRVVADAARRYMKEMVDEYGWVILEVEGGDRGAFKMPMQRGELAGFVSRLGGGR